MGMDARDSWWSWRTEEIKEFFEWPTQWLRFNIGLFVAVWWGGSAWFAWKLTTRPNDPEPAVVSALASLVLIGVLVFFIRLIIMRWPPNEAEVGRLDDDTMFALVKEARATSRHADTVTLHWFSLLVLIHGSIIGVWFWLADKGWWETTLTQAVRTISSLLLFFFTATAFSVVSRAVKAADQEHEFVKKYTHDEVWSNFIEKGRKTGIEKLMDIGISLGVLIIAYGWFVYFLLQLANLVAG